MALSNLLDSWDKEDKPESSSLLRRTLGDTAVSVAKGVANTGQAAVGLLDIPTLGYAGKALDYTGYNPQQTNKFLEELYTPEQQAANREVQNANGFTETLGAAIANPSTIYHGVVESLPLMLGGQAIAKGAMSATPQLGRLAAGAAGEGIITAGSQAEQIRQQTPDNLLTLPQVGYAAGSGAITGGITALSGGLANKLGAGDIDTAFLGGQGGTGGAVSRFLKGGLTEGALEEMPQSMQEQMASNLALDKPVMEGVGSAAAQGGLLGFAQGGGTSAAFGGFGGRNIQPPSQAALNNDATAPTPIPPPEPQGALSRAVSKAPQLGAHPLSLPNLPADEIITFSDGSQARSSEVLQHLTTTGYTPEQAQDVVSNLLTQSKKDPQATAQAQQQAEQQQREQDLNAYLNVLSDNQENQRIAEGLKTEFEQTTLPKLQEQQQQEALQREAENQARQAELARRQAQPIITDSDGNIARFSDVKTAQQHLEQQGLGNSHVAVRSYGDYVVAKKDLTPAQRTEILKANGKPQTAPAQNQFLNSLQPEPTNEQSQNQTTQEITAAPTLTPQQKQTRNPIDHENDNLLTAIRKLGGLNKASFDANGGDSKFVKQNGVNQLFRNDEGMSIDDMQRALRDEGFLQDDGNDQQLNNLLHEPDVKARYSNSRSNFYSVYADRLREPEQDANTTPNREGEKLLDTYTNSDITEREAKQRHTEKEQITKDQAAERKRKADLEVDTLADEMLGIGGTTTADLFDLSSTNKAKPEKQKPKSLQDLIRNQDLPAILNHIIAGKSSFSGIAQVLKNKLPSNLKFQVVPELKAVKDKTRDIPAKFNKTTNTILLNEKYLSSKDKDLMEFVLHELAHAETVFALANDSSPFRSELDSIIKKIESHAVNGNLTAKGINFFKVSRLFDKNGKPVAEELVAYGLTDPRFQVALQDIAYNSSKSLWDKFVDSIAKALGIPVNDANETALAAVLRLSAEVMNAQQAKQSPNPRYTTQDMKAVMKMAKDRYNDVKWDDNESESVKNDLISLSGYFDENTYIRLRNKGVLGAIEYKAKPEPKQSPSVNDDYDDTIPFSKAKTTERPYTSKQSLTQALRKALDSVFGDGWFSRLLATGKVKIISSEEADRVISGGELFHRAWHGTPHDFDKFELSKIGTGEGAQAFGYGLYFADSKKIAEWYRDKLAYKSLSDDEIESTGGHVMIGFSDGLKELDEKIEKQKNKTPPKWAYKKGREKDLEDFLVRIQSELNEFIKWRENLLSLEKKILSSKKLYEIELSPSQDEYLLWDKSISEQSSFIKSALENEKINLSEKGYSIYHSLSKKYGSDKAASEYLHSLGIRGIKYLDGTSRGKGDGNYNYVIFDDNDIQIVAKYSKNGKVQAFYNPKDDTTYFVYDNIDQRTDLVKLMMHEIGVHALQMGKDSKSFENILNQVADLAKNSKNPIIQRAVKAAKDANTPANLMNEEIAGYLVEFHPKLSISQKILAWFRSQLRKLGITKINEKDLVYMASQALRKAPTSLFFDEPTRKAGIRESYAGQKAKNADLFEEQRQYKEVEARYFNEDGTSKDGAMLAPNGMPTNLNKMQWIQVRTPNFIKWFGDFINDPENASKVVDSNGEPLIVYHKTNADFSVFDKNKSKDGFGIHFGTKEAAKSLFIGNEDSSAINYTPVFLNIKNMTHERHDAGRWFYKNITQAFRKNWQELPVEKRNEINSKLENDGYGEYAGSGFYKTLDDIAIKHKGDNKEVNGLIADMAHKYGLDGIAYINSFEDTGSLSYIVFDAKQIKSAIGNTGAFSQDNDDIRYSLASTVTDFFTGEETRATTLDDIDTMLSTGRQPRRDTGLQYWKDKVVTAFTDATRPFERFVSDYFPPELASAILSGSDRALGMKAAFEREAMNLFGRDIGKAIRAIVKANPKFNYKTAKDLAGTWLSVRYAPIANDWLMQKDQQRVDDLIAQGAPQKEINKAKADQAKRIAAINDPNIIDVTKQPSDAGLAGGYNNATAQHLKDKIEAEIDVALLEKLADHVYDMNEWKLKQDIKNGKISQDTADKFPKSRFYVPLTGDPRTDESLEDVFSVGNVNQAKDRAIGGRTTSLAQNGIDASFEQLEKSARYHGWKDFKEAIENAYDSLIQAKLDDGKTQKEAEQEVWEENQIKRRAEDGFIGENDIVVRKDGKGMIYTINNQAAMEALRSVNNEDVPSILKPIAYLTRLQARLVTQFMPLFALTNMIRDVAERTENIRTRKIQGFNGDMNQVANDSIKNAGRLLMRIKPVMMGVLAENTPLAKLFPVDNANPDVQDLKRFLALGGSSTYGDILSNDSKKLSDKLKATGTIPNNVMEAIHLYNNAFELISGFSIYQSLINQGLDERKAATASLNLMNFRKRGKVMTPIRALYMFAQPIATGGHQLAKTLSTPRGLARFATYTVASAFLYSLLRSGDDDDELGINKMDEQGNFTLYRNILIPMGDGTYFKVPVGFGMQQLAWSHGVNLVRMAAGSMTPAETAAESIALWTKSAAPIAPAETAVLKHPLVWATQTFTPQIAKPIVNSALDVNAFGSPLTNARYEKEDKAKALQGRRDTPAWYKMAAEELAKATGGQVDMYPEQLRELLRGYGAGVGNEMLKWAIENPAKEQRGLKVVSPAIDRYVLQSNDDSLKTRLYYRKRDLMNELEIKQSVGEALTPEEQRLVKLNDELKKMEGRARGKLSAARKAERLKQMAKANNLTKQADNIKQRYMDMALTARA